MYPEAAKLFEPTLKDYQDYLTECIELQITLEGQVKKGLIKLSSIPSHDDYLIALAKFKTAIESGDLEAMFLEKIFLDVSMNSVTNAIWTHVNLIAATLK